MIRSACLALALAGTLLAPVAAHADKSYSLPRATVSVVLERDGEVSVREDLTYRFSGTYSGAYRDIPLRRDVTARDVEVSEDGKAYAPDGKTTLGSTDAAGRYGFYRSEEGVRIVWHFREHDGERTFTLRYRLRGVAIAHDDAVEVAPLVWGSQWEHTLTKLHASASATGALERTRAWIEPVWLDHRVSVQGGAVSTTVERIPRERGVTLWVLFPPAALAPGAPYARHVHNLVVASTEAREVAAQKRAERDERELEDTLHHPWLWVLAAIALAIVPAGLLAGLCWWMLGRDPATGSTPEYLNEPPDDMAPALVPSLLAQRLVAGGDQMAATLFELVRRGRYKLTPYTRERSELGGLRSGEIDDVELTRGNKGSKLNTVEKPIAAIFDRLLKPGHPLALSRIEETVEGWPDDDREWFHGRSEGFKGIIASQARKRSFWDERGTHVRKVAVVLLLLAGFSSAFAGVVGITDPPLLRQNLILVGTGVALGLNALVLLLTPARVWRRRAREMQASAERWGAFRRYLRDFPRLADKPADTLPLWESYLVYGISFGLADRVMEAARIDFPQVVVSPIYAPWWTVGSAATFGASSFGGGLGSAFGAPSIASSDTDMSGGGSFAGGGGDAW